MTELWKVIVSPEPGRHALYSIDRVGEMHVTTRAVIVNLVDPGPTTVVLQHAACIRTQRRRAPTSVAASPHACDVGGR